MYKISRVYYVSAWETLLPTRLLKSLLAVYLNNKSNLILGCRSALCWIVLFTFHAQRTPGTRP